MQTDRVVFETVPTESGLAFGRATLNAPGSLNALSQDMIDALGERLFAWADDASIAGVILDARGERAFCAGGDVSALYRAIRAANGLIPVEAERFFEHEYRLDHRIHTYPKPVLCWGHGIVMGGGVGLFAGASHRVATSQTRLAMPEISIGLYPDVGGSWILGRLRGRLGLFLALTAASLNASDLRVVGLADYRIDNEARETVVRAISDAAWSGDAEADRARLSHLLERFADPLETQPSPIRAHGALIDNVMGHDTLADIAPRLIALREHDDRWLAAAGAAFANGSPTSAALAFELLRRTRHWSLADVFRLEYQASLGCCAHQDFAEGVRALLVDKDRNPRWSPATLADVRPSHVEAHLVQYFSGPHPLADLR